MPDQFEQLTAEYMRLLMAFETRSATQPDIVKALLHILQRLGPPSLTEASEVEHRAAGASLNLGLE